MVRDYMATVVQVREEELQQMQDGVELFLHRCLTQFSGAPPQNGAAISSGADYAMPARTAEEINGQVAAEQGSVTAAKKGFKLTDSQERIAKREGLADPAAQFDENPSKPVAPRPAAPLPPSAPIKPEGWII